MFCELSSEADVDLGAIYDFTCERFGTDQAEAYLTQLGAIFTRLLEYPELGRDRPDIRAGLRSIPHDSHIIFYRILDDRVRIIRILHANRDIPRLL